MSDWRAIKIILHTRAVDIFILYNNGATAAEGDRSIPQRSRYPFVWRQHRATADDCCPMASSRF